MIYKLKIQLQGVKKPPVWRRVLVNSDITFDDLHMVIQTAMGWGNYHLYQFGYRAYDPASSIGIQMPDDWDPPRYNAKHTPISAFLNLNNKKMKYVYDFGDDWIHDITLEEAFDDPEILDSLPLCTDAKSACPPEDCGGVWGYEELKSFSTANHLDPEDRDRLKWYGMGADFDPKYVDISQINKSLKKLKFDTKKQQKQAKVAKEKLQKLEERAELLKTMLAGCCRNFLKKEELVEPCENTVDLLKNSEFYDITRGSAEIWAAGILIELYDGIYGFWLDTNGMSAEKISNYFNVKKTSAMNRVYEVRTLLSKHRNDEAEFIYPGLSEMSALLGLADPARIAETKSNPKFQEIVEAVTDEVTSGKINSFGDLIATIDKHIEKHRNK